MAADETIQVDVKGNADKYAKSIADAANGTLALAKAEKAAAKERAKAQREQDAQVRSLIRGQQEVVGKVGAAALAWKAYDLVISGLATAWDQLLMRQVEGIRTLDRLSGASALSEETLQGLRVAAKDLELNLEDMVPVGLTDKLTELRSGSDSAEEDFALLGLTVADFIGLDADQSFRRIVRAMQEMTDTTRRAAGAQRILGGEGEKIAALSAPIEDYIDRSKGLGIANAESAESARDLADALETLDLAVENVSVAFTEALGSEAAGAIKAFAIVALITFRAMTEEAAGFVKQIRGVAAFMEGDFVAAGDLLSEGASQSATAFTTATTAAASFGKALDEDVGPAALDTGEDLAVVRTETKKAGDAAKKSAGQVFDLAAALERLRQIQKDAEASGLTEEERIQAAYQQRVDAVIDAIEAADRQGATQLQLQDLLIAGDEAIRQSGLERDRSLAESAERRAAAEREAIEEARRLGLEAYEERKRLQALEDAQNAEAIAKREADTERAALDITALTAQAGYSLAELLEDSGKRTRGAALAAFRVAQVAAIAQATINAALAASQGLASAPPPFSFALAAANAAAGAVQVATIAAQRPPSFHIGNRESDIMARGDLAPDEIRTRRESTTAVLTPQGVANANAGVQSGWGPAPVLVQIGHQVVGRAAAESVRRPTSLLSRTMKRDLVGHSRRRT